MRCAPLDDCTYTLHLVMCMLRCSARSGLGLICTERTTIAGLRPMHSTVRSTVPAVLRRYCNTPYIPAGYFSSLSRTCARLDHSIRLAQACRDPLHPKCDDGRGVRKGGRYAHHSSKVQSRQQCGGRPGGGCTVRLRVRCLMITMRAVHTAPPAVSKLNLK